jgi:hypothetical protein
MMDMPMKGGAMENMLRPFDPDGFARRQGLKPSGLSRQDK